MKMRFHEKVAIVTGGASGIGAAVVRLLVRDGAKVAISDLNRASGEALAAEFGHDHALFSFCDVSKLDDVEILIAATMSAFGRIDLLVNCAGIGTPPITAPNLDPEIWHRVMAVNLDSVFYCCRTAIPHMRGKATAIVNVASISGLAGDAGFNAYNASKAAVINYTRTLAIDHADDQIRVNAVCPGIIDTPLTQGVSGQSELWQRWTACAPMKRAGQPEEIAEVIVFLLSPQSSYMTGAAVVADGGMTAWTGQPNLLELTAVS